jgi:hypothetical protein
MLSEAKRPPGKPWVGSMGYVPPAATNPKFGVIHATALKLAHDFVFALRLVS